MTFLKKFLKLSINNRSHNSEQRFLKLVNLFEVFLYHNRKKLILEATKKLLAKLDKMKLQTMKKVLQIIKRVHKI